MSRTILLVGALVLAASATECGAVSSGSASNGSIGGSPPIASDDGPPGAPSSWYAARLETSLNHNDAVGTATDFGTNAWDATQGTAAKKPTFKSPCESGKLNELPCFDFDGGDLLTTGTKATEAQPFILAAVLRYDAAATDIMVDGTGVDTWLYQVSDLYRVYASSSQGSTSITQGEYSWQCFYGSGPSSTATVNGTEESVSPGTNGVGGLTLGSDPAGTFDTDGALAEVLYYDDPDVQGVTCAEVGTFFDSIYGGSWPQ